MSDYITIRPASGTWTVRAGGAVIAETTAALELTEGQSAPVIYFPRADIAMAFLDKTDTVSTCPHKGQATYYSIIAKSGEIKDAGWSYETPLEAVDKIAGHIAFYSTEKVSVEQI